MIACQIRSVFISIHPPREGWDPGPAGSNQAPEISIHPPREGWDPMDAMSKHLTTEFQSTHPVRGGTFS